MDEPVVVGEVLLGKYRVERILGQGGMGIVVAVRHVELGQLAAMKFLLPDAIGHAESLERFLREAKAAARLTSEHAARVQDVGRMENGAPYMLMEYLEGCDLKAFLSREGPLPVGDAVMYVLQVCEAIAEAHAAGIVHRDLKPANLFLVRRRNGSPCVKVIDFGIAKRMDPEQVDLTKTKAALGSPLYMSPEQMEKSKTVDARTDIWALGVILYELLAGTSPFRGTSVLEVASRVLQEEPTPLHELRRDVPAELEGVITKCLRKHRDERIQSVDELQEALTKLVSSGMLAPAPWPSVTNQPVVVTDGVMDGETTTTTFGRTGKPLVVQKPRSMWRAVGAGLVLVIAVGVGSSPGLEKPRPLMIKMGPAANGALPAMPAEALAPMASASPAAPTSVGPSMADLSAPAPTPRPSVTSLPTPRPRPTAAPTTHKRINNSPF